MYSSMPGSLSHYNNKHKQHGDFSIPFANYLSKHNSIFMGDEAPWFMNTVYEYFMGRLRLNMLKHFIRIVDMLSSLLHLYQTMYSTNQI